MDRRLIIGEKVGGGSLGPDIRIRLSGRRPSSPSDSENNRAVQVWRTLFLVPRIRAKAGLVHRGRNARARRSGRQLVLLDGYVLKPKVDLLPWCLLARADFLAQLEVAKVQVRFRP